MSYLGSGKKQIESILLLLMGCNGVSLTHSVPPSKNKFITKFMPKAYPTLQSELQPKKYLPPTDEQPEILHPPPLILRFAGRN